MITILIILIIFSAFFSASETSYFNLKKHQNIDSRVRRLLSKPRELLTFILIFIMSNIQRIMKCIYIMVK